MLGGMTTPTNATSPTADRTAPVRVFRVWIKATPEAVWDAITKPEWVTQYGYQSPMEYDLRPGGAFRGLPSPAMTAYGAPEVILDGEVIEADPPHTLVQTWRILWDAEAKEEGFTRLSYELLAQPSGVTRLTLTHELQYAPRTAGLVSGDIEPFGGGWPEILSDLKSLLETGKSMHA
jgi:uncharacterized protein YndB with AHSA1/START domain